MAKTKKSANPRDAYPKLPAQPAPPAKASSPHAIRETVESIVIAFVLAFLFRTFEAEAFVIPTGSMAPTLMGAHKDVDCIKCGHRFQINSSDENGERAVALLAKLRSGTLAPNVQAILENEYMSTSCQGGMCPNCRYVNPMRPNLPIDQHELVDAGDVQTQKKYNGDRILVNKYVYTVSDPSRWDVVVFKFPGNAQMNYIKRLVGLPGETIRVYQGDLFTATKNNPSDADFAIARKPPEVQLAMRQLVHDTNYDPVELFQAGWPLRWKSDESSSAWKTEATIASPSDMTVSERYSVDTPAGETAWLRYRHFIPSYDEWRQVEDYKIAAQNGPPDTVPPGERAQPQLVADFNAYNARASDASINNYHDLRVEPELLGLHWVSDLMVEANVEVEEAKGEFILELVEAGKRFTATIDLATGRAVLGAGGLAGFAPAAETTLQKPGDYSVAFSNVDDQLRLWVDGTLVEFAASTEYDADEIWGSRTEIIPQTSESDPGDLAPAAIGARGAKLAVTRLQLWRDIYYVADSSQRIYESRVRENIVTDFAHPFDPALRELPRNPSIWDRFRERNHVEFPLTEDQFFVMGDNSPASSDARLWLGGDSESGGRPGGSYLERQLLIGRALCVYWPHSWNRIPGTPIPFPLFPNVEDMRLVR